MIEQMEEEDHQQMSSLNDAGPESDEGNYSSRNSSPDNEEGMSLLEELREMTYWKNSEEDDLVKMRHVMRNIHKLPRKLRRPIADAAAYAAATAALNEDNSNTDESGPHVARPSFDYLVSCSVEMFLFGCPILEVFDFSDTRYEPFELFLDVDDPTEWLGLDSDIDTKDEVEMMLRLYPEFYGCKKTIGCDVLIGEHGCCDFLVFLASSEKAVTFIPLIVDLAYECGMLDNLDVESLSVALLDNEIVTQMFDEEPSTKLVEESLSILVHLKEKGYVHTRQIKRIGWSFFQHQDEFTTLPFVERRVRLLAQWDPTILKPVPLDPENPIATTTLLHMVFCNEWNEWKPDFRFYKLVLELGMTYYPNELLGFGFQEYKNANDDDSTKSYSCLNLACKECGEKEAKRVMNDTIAATLAQSKQNDKNKTLLEWVLKAATNSTIHLDGVYTLIRFNPSVVTNGIK